jgi:hypothetical protein
MILDTVNRNKCFITYESTELFGKAQFPLKKSGYRVGVNGRYFMVQFDLDEIGHLDRDSDLLKLIEKNFHIFRGHLYNNKWLSNEDQSNTLINSNSLELLLKQYDYPKTHTEKMEKLFFELASRSEWDGQVTEIGDEKMGIMKKCYFKNEHEYLFYFRTLKQAGFISGDIVENATPTPIRFSLTYDGLAELSRLSDEGAKSKRCFVAMSFDSEDENIFHTIKAACYEANQYDAFRIDQEHLESHQTINDGIIAAIKKSKFCIADFTKQKDGVYFEAGYAVGRGMKVIYTCHEKDWENTHFDVDHFPHIIYKSPEELKRRLIDKIQAWID